MSVQKSVSIEYMKIVSWNVNGLRAIHRKGNWEWLLKESPDIFCLQETKAHPEQLPDDVREPEGYHSYFSASDVKKGYSGVATYTKRKPTFTDIGIGAKDQDDEGRVVETHFGSVVLLNVYFPNGKRSPERLQHKLDFYDAFLAHIEQLRTQGKSIIFCGDVNTAHTEIDLSRPKENEKISGFLPEEREWMDALESAGYVDTFRHFYPNKKEMYTWWDMKSRARDRNVGWRIDYFFISPDLLSKLKKVEILTDVYGSDHCPVMIEIGL